MNARFCYWGFTHYLKNSRAELPLKLVTEIKSRKWDQLESDALCEKIYGESDEQSLHAAQILLSAGFRNVAQIIGGLTTWREIAGATAGI